jgi:hypothetical protein
VVPGFCIGKARLIFFSGIFFVEKPNRRFLETFIFAKKIGKGKAPTLLRESKNGFQDIKITIFYSVLALLDRLFNVVPRIDESVCPVVPRILGFPRITVRGRYIHVQADHHLRVGLNLK